jgi:hypothetical protein
MIFYIWLACHYCRILATRCVNNPMTCFDSGLSGKPRSAF